MTSTYVRQGTFEEGSRSSGSQRVSGSGSRVTITQTQTSSSQQPPRSTRSPSQPSRPRAVLRDATASRASHQLGPRRRIVGVQSDAGGTGARGPRRRLAA